MNFQAFLQKNNHIVNNMIMNNNIIAGLFSKGVDFDIYEGSKFDTENDTVYQYFIINTPDEDDFINLFADTQQVIYINRELDLYILGVTHFGTAWSEVTDF